MVQIAMASISSILNDCFRQFNNLTASAALQQNVTKISPDLWQDELGRLRVWAANIGAHQTGRSSLDYRLRDASNIRDQIIRLLKGLRRAFDDLEDVLHELEEGYVPVEDDSEPEDDDGSEVQQIFKGLVNTIDCLFQMSMVVRRPTQHDRFVGIKKADSAPFEPYDQQHVDNKFPRAEQDIINRLGTAISRRRAGLRYRERHRAKMSKGLNSTLGNQSETGSTILSDTVATEFEGNQHIQFDESGSNSGVSQTSYAQTLLESNDRISIPSPPRESADGKPFECPYCFFVITIRDRRSWIRHIFTDLMPYVCVFPDCSTPTMLYASRREWYHHLQTRHLIQAKQDSGLHCPLCQEEATREVRLDRHIGRHLEELALFALPRTETEADRTSSGAYAVSEHFSDVVHSEQSDDEGTPVYQSASSGRIEDWEKRVSSDSTEDEAIAKFDKLILEERAERESKEAAVARAEADRAREESPGLTNEVEAEEAKPIAVTPEAEANDASERVASLPPTTAKSRGVPAPARANKPTESTWFCSICNDGPYAQWQTSCQQCGHRRCTQCQVVKHNIPSLDT